MSRYGYFVCTECKVMLWLGKAIFLNDDKISFFHIGQEEDLPNSQRVVLNRTLWKMFADHARHTLRVVVEWDPEFVQLDNYIEIGGDRYKDISFDSYLKNWPA